MSVSPSRELQHLWVLAPYWELIPTTVLSCPALIVPAAARIQTRAIKAVGKELGGLISKKSLQALQLHCGSTDWERHGLEKVVGRHIHHRHRKEA